MEWQGQRGKVMRKPIVVAVVLVVLLAASAYAQTDFFALVKSGSPQDVQAAISNGADVKARDTTYGWTPLMVAAGFNPNPEVITVLIKAGSDIKAQDPYGRTALMAAAGDQSPEMITVLLNAGSEINAHNSSGVTALMAAAGYNQNFEVITILLKAGADAKAKDLIGQTALDYAQDNVSQAKLKDTDAYQQLLKASQ